MSKRANSATGGARGARAGKQTGKRASGRTNRPNEEAKPPRMRIIAGAWRGRPIVAPKGEGTRPTTDRVREAVMSAVSSARGGFDDAVVLDAFAGSGALGLEALSRGAASAHFYEVEGAALRALRANCEKLGCARGAGQGRGLRGPAELLGGPGAPPPCGPSTERAHVHRDDVLKAPARPRPAALRPAVPGPAVRLRRGGGAPRPGGAALRTGRARAGGAYCLRARPRPGFLGAAAERGAR